MLCAYLIRRAAVAVAAAGLLLAMQAAAPALAKSRWGKDYLPNVELVTQEGKTVRLYDDVFKGKIVVVGFIYTTCLDICPLITARMAQVYEQLGEAAGRDIHFVSISIDPVTDTPEKLKTHAEAFRSDPNWVFLTGDPKNIELVRYKLGERSRKLSEHQGMVMLYNDRTGEWSRDSVFADLGALEIAIRSMDPKWRDSTVRAAEAQLAAPATGTGAAHPVVDLPGQALFVKACASCHTIGHGDRVGPDLRDVSARRERAWLLRFMQKPATLHAGKDPIALALAAAYPKVRMPNLKLSASDATDLLSYLDARSFAVTEGGKRNAANGQGHAAHHHHGHGGHVHSPSGGNGQHSGHEGHGTDHGRHGYESGHHHGADTQRPSTGQ